MPENSGLYQKFDVKRRDGRDAEGGDRENAVYFVLDVVNDPFALDALRCYRMVCEGRCPSLAETIFALEAEMKANNRQGPMHTALRTPK